MGLVMVISFTKYIQLSFSNFVTPNERRIDDEWKEVMKTTKLFDYLLIHTSQQSRMWFIINVIQEMEKVLNYKGRHTFKWAKNEDKCSEIYNIIKYTWHVILFSSH
jgi:hypothetical protein